MTEIDPVSRRGQPRSMSGLRRHAAPALVFVTSGAVLVIEILAGRLLAPYVGVSLETYTGIIGTVLAGLALGSVLGGRAADRFDARGLLGPLIILAGLATLLTVPIIVGLGPTVAADGGGPLGIVIMALAAFVVPTALLSAVTPLVAKVRLDSTEETGRVVGGLSAAGTAGALTGTFGTGFVLVATVPTRPLVSGVGVLLLVLGVTLSINRRRWGTSAVAALLVVLGLVQVSPVPCDHETAYYCANVIVDPARPSGRTLMLDNLRHSYVDLRDPTHLEFRYARLFGAVIDANFGTVPLDSLHIGGGGFTFPRWLAATRPGSESTVLELDPAIVAIATAELGLEQGPSLQVRTGDARLAVVNEPTDSYDLVVGDAFGGLSVPWHLTTTEMVASIARTLRPDGIYILNMIDSGPRRLVRAELATLAATFAEVALIAPPDGDGNHVLVASRAPIDLGTFDPSEGIGVTGDDLLAFVGRAQELRDDFAPADQLLTRS